MHHPRQASLAGILHLSSVAGLDEPTPRSPLSVTRRQQPRSPGGHGLTTLRGQTSPHLRQMLLRHMSLRENHASAIPALFPLLHVHEDLRRDTTQRKYIDIYSAHHILKGRVDATDLGTVASTFEQPLLCKGRAYLASSIASSLPQ